MLEKDFAEFIQTTQNRSFHGTSKSDFVDNISEKLFSIRDGAETLRAANWAIQREKNSLHPDKAKINRIRTAAISSVSNSYHSMEAINEMSQNEIGKNIFRISGSFLKSSKTRSEFIEEAIRYEQSLRKRITQNPSRFIPQDKENTQYEDRLYVESFLQEEMIRERVRELPENSNKEFRISSFEELNKIISKRKEEEPQHTQRTPSKENNFER